MYYYCYYYCCYYCLRWSWLSTQNAVYIHGAREYCVLPTTLKLNKRTAGVATRQLMCYMSSGNMLQKDLFLEDNYNTWQPYIGALYMGGYTNLSGHTHTHTRGREYPGAPSQYIYTHLLGHLGGCSETPSPWCDHAH